jgi:gluconate 2-dehydrogenase gamma chain
MTDNERDGSLTSQGGRTSRREVIKLMSVAVGGAVTGVAGSMLIGRIDRSPPGGWRFLTPDEARLVEVVSEQIIPADKDPGAKDAGVVYFIDLQLAGPYTRFQAKYRAGLQSLQQTSRKTLGKPFEELAWDDQTRLLASLEAGKAPKEYWTDPAAKEFFDLLRDHTMQGFYGSPRHGGNRNYCSYKMLGLEYPRVLGQNRYPRPKSPLRAPTEGWSGEG